MKKSKPGKFPKSVCRKLPFSKGIGRLRIKCSRLVQKP